MQKDHNLDDLIIDDIKPAKSKGKGILTIIALLLIVLPGAIMMSSLFFGERDQNTTAIEQGQDDLISSDLKLDTSNHDPEADKKELEQLSSMMEETLTDEKAKPTEASQEADSKDKPVAKEPEVIEQAPEAPKAEEVKPETTVVAEEPQPIKKPVAIETVEKPVKKPEPQAHKPAPKPKPKPKHVAKSGSYYIQVGSFTQRPSSRFLSVITNSGFHYVLKGGKLLIGPYNSDAAARRVLPRVKSKINKGAFIKHL
jgi:DedD protein